ncbi:MAG: cytochrome C peroxidase [Verrucomicrobiaceae bacterium]|nr:cytochrome C peroxidase [Verrucomicrobiaceae bacterium]
MKSHVVTALLAVMAAMPLSGEASILRIAVQHRVGDAPLMLDSLRYANGAGETFSVTRLSYLISGLALRRADGSWFEVADSTAWMNAATHRVTTRFEGIIPDQYQALRFRVGLDKTANASDPAQRAPDHPLNPNLNGLHWSWQGGYIFMALEGMWRRGNDQPKGFALHLARDPFLTEVTIEKRIDLRKDAEELLILDVAAIFSGAKKISFEKDGTTTHSKDGDPLAVAMRDNLSKAWSIRADVIAPTVIEAVKPRPKPLYMPAKLTPYRFEMAAYFPMPDLPPDNPLLEERVALGDKLFHDNALSLDGTVSCSSCHVTAAALSDPRRFSIGIRAQSGNRNGMAIFNMAWKREFFWDGRAPSLRAQTLMPIQDPREMGETPDGVVAKLRASKDYAGAFERAFGSPEITSEKIGLALENFVLTLTSFDSKFDRSQRGVEKLTADEERGFLLFMTEREPRLGSMGADCFHCHGGALFTDHQFRNNGLAIDEADLGRAKVTKAAIDRGAFATPSLRNVALTAPYMHDGRFATLEEVIDHYSEGVKRTDTLDPNLAKHPDGGLHLSADDKRCLVAFLRTLSDGKFASQKP